MQKQADEQLLAQLKANDPKAREAAFEYIYENFYEGIAAYIIQNKGSNEEARDVFQDGLIVLYNQVLKGAFQERSTVKTYLYGICRNIWYKKLNKKKTFTSENDLMNVAEDYPEIDQILIGNEREQLLSKLLEQLSSECNNILKLFYYEKLSMKKIKVALQLASEQVAKNKKMKCLKKLRTLVKNSAAYTAILKHNN